MTRYVRKARIDPSRPQLQRNTMWTAQTPDGFLFFQAVRAPETLTAQYCREVVQTTAVRTGHWLAHRQRRTLQWPIWRGLRSATR